jgi:hypothetical protein
LYNVSLGKVNDIRRVARKIVPALSRDLIRWPSDQEAHNNSVVFAQRYGFPSTVGAIDGSLIPIANPSAEFTTRKFNQALTLQAVVDPQIRFIDTFIGCSGRMHDARVYQYSPLSDKLRRADYLNGIESK